MNAENFKKGSSHRIILGSPTLQTTSRRIALPIRMPLTGESFGSMPSWVGTAFEAVSRYLNEASPDVQQIAGLELGFHNDKPTGELFVPPSAKAQGCELKGFTVTRVGDPDGDPEVELQFKSYIPATREFWAWIFEMAGKEVFMEFPKTVGAKPAATKQDRLPGIALVDQPPSAEETAILQGDEADSDPDLTALASADSKPSAPKKSAAKKTAPKKSGPKELAAYHANRVN